MRFMDDWDQYEKISFLIYPLLAAIFGPPVMTIVASSCASTDNIWRIWAPVPFWLFWLLSGLFYKTATALILIGTRNTNRNYLG